MARENLIRLICDYCGTKELISTDQEKASETAVLLRPWIQVLYGSGHHKFYCRKGCAINGINQHDDGQSIILPPSGIEAPTIG